MNKDKQVQATKYSSFVNFMNGGLAGMLATTIVQPIDLLKTRIQLRSEHEKMKYKTPLSLARKIYSSDGLLGFYQGYEFVLCIFFYLVFRISAALLRQATYTTIRLGLFNTLNDIYKGRHSNSNPNYFWKLIFAMTAGGVSSMISTPTETVLIRMTSDARLPPNERRNYSNCFTAIHRIYREEGMMRLWSGWQPTVVRAIILNGAQLSVYSQSKDLLLERANFKDGIIVHTLSSINAAFFSTLASIPVDNIKSHLQSMKKGEYSGAYDVLSRTCQKEGICTLWKGFFPYFLRLGPHTILTFVFFEYLSTLTKSKL